MHAKNTSKVSNNNIGDEPLPESIHDPVSMMNLPVFSLKLFQDDSS